jgi:enoyl-CoA hydratase
MGQHAALQACFDIHQLGHASALAQTGKLSLMGLGGMKEQLKTS